VSCERLSVPLQWRRFARDGWAFMFLRLPFENVFTASGGGGRAAGSWPRAARRQSYRGWFCRRGPNDGWPWIL